MKEHDIDIAIIGGGASGLAAAVSAAEHSRCRITVFERLQRVGKKLLSTGNGRCNLSNENLSPEYYSGDKQFLSFVKDVPDANELFRSVGLITRTDNEGRIYPHSMAASSVLDALRHKASACGVEMLCQVMVSDIRKDKDTFIIITNNEQYRAKSVIISSGGRAAPSFGSDGTGYTLAKRFGHTVTELYPALAPIRTDINKVKALKGLRTYAEASLLINGQSIAKQTGEVQFSDGALSGICIFNLSALAAKNVGKCEISLDIAPSLSEKELTDALFSAAKIRSELPCEELLTGLAHKRIGQQLLKAVGISCSMLCKDISERDIKNVAAVIKDRRFPVTGISDWSLAQSTEGGIPAKEVTPKLMSKKADGLFFSGEILDICGQCGGYNLDWAWKSGYLAGTAAAEYILGGKYD